tara:strand:+ start:4900 stop:5763 length:864 start_codon:yes stop_codon:yes gene_type:complete
MYKKHFVTYGDKKYNIQKKRLSLQAKSFELFDEIHTYSRKDLSKKFLSKYKKIIDNEIGGGFWIWKIYIINKLLFSTNEGDMIFYLDSGSTLNINGKDRLEEYFNLLQNSDEAFLRFSIDKKEKYWTTKELFNYFDLSLESDEANSDQLAGGILFIKNNEISKNFINKFFEALDFDNNLVTNYYSQNQIDGFVSPRHDQSILSLLGKINESIIIKDETYFADNLIEQYKYPILTVRDGRYSFWQKFKFYINYFDNLKKPIFFGENNYYFNKVSFYKRIKFKILKLFN